MKHFYLLIFFAVVLISCKASTDENKKVSNSDERNNLVNQVIERPPLLDSIINLGIHESILTEFCEFNNSEAIKYLLKYFKHRGILPRKDVKINTHGNSKTCISYDTIHKFAANRFCGGIISYWLGPADLNGHCFLPSHSVIQLTENGYKISNVNFIPSNFILDSIQETILYGFIYDCGRSESKRPFKITLK